MEFSLDRLLSAAFTLLPTAITIAIAGGVLSASKMVLNRRRKAEGHKDVLGIQSLMMVLTLIGVVAVVLSLPNTYIASQPVNVVRSSGAIISSTTSIGYDVSRKQLKPLLLEAATEAGLEDPFVRILELGDFAVTYQVSGLLRDVGKILTARSSLNGKVLDCLHGAGIEIASPTIMNQRAIAGGQRFLPPAGRMDDLEDTSDEEPTADLVAFDKADAAALQEKLKQLEEGLKTDIKALANEGESAATAGELRRSRAHLERVELALEQPIDED